MFARKPKSVIKWMYVCLLTGGLALLTSCATTKDGDYYVRNHHNENMTKITVQNGEVVEREITFEQYIAETKK